MVVTFEINLEDGIVSMSEETEFGTTVEKTVDLDEFLQHYTAYVKSNKDNYSFLYLPPGTVEYRKGINKITLFVETHPYKEFYGINNVEEDYFIVMQIDLEGKNLISYRGYKTKGAFNSNFSSFYDICSDEEKIPVTNEDEAIKICLNKILSSEKKINFNKKRYLDIA